MCCWQSQNSEQLLFSFKVRRFGIARDSRRLRSRVIRWGELEILTASLHSMADIFRSPAGAATSSGGASTPSEGTIAKEKRLKFSIVLPVWAQDVHAFKDCTTFPGTMRLVAGHVAIWGWFLAALEALEAGDGESLAALWQAALPATIQANIVNDRSRLAAISIGMSNTFYVNAVALADTFPAFACKLMLAVQQSARSRASTPSQASGRTDTVA